ncbi:MAG TPA: DUF983 domain-containing protein [Saprospiraceae bacterium]|nr:DUF983 domain-containing protein [Saprospiraceae bacterium]
MKRRSKLISIVTHTCPRCHTGELFETRILSFSKLFHMPKSCPQCGLNYYPEPGFYYGAMFISYIVTAFYCLGFIGIALFLFHMSVNTAFVWLFVSLVIFYVWFYRTARSLWIHINVKYDKKAKAKAEAKENKNTNGT